MEETKEEGEGSRRNNGILKMSPKSQSKFFQSLNDIYQEQDARRVRNGQPFEEDSPEYTIVSAIDNSCVLFAVSNENRNISEGEEDNSGNSSQILISPCANRHFFDDGSDVFSNPDLLRELAVKL